MPYTRAPKTQRRVVVTGVGALTPLGLSMEESWKRALAGESGLGPITRFDASSYDTRIAGEIKGFNADEYVPKKEQRRMDRFIHLSLAATKMALDSSGLKLEGEVAEKTGVLIGVGIGGLPAIEEAYSVLNERGPGRMSPFFIPMIIANMASGQVSITYGAKGPNYSITSACASAAHSIGEAIGYIRNGSCDVMITGGAESAVCGLAIGGFGAMKALSRRNDEPTRASRPFDRDRDGFVLSEGAAILILEDMESAVKRGAPILCEVTGYGTSSDAHHMTNPAPEGAGARAAMEACLKDADLTPEVINYINAHGTSTPVGDEMETLAIKKLFGDHAKKLWVSSTKSVTGHTLGAAGAIESAFCVMAIKDQVAPPTINLENPSEGCDLDYLADGARAGKLDHVLNNSFGFGGTNACLLFSKAEV